MRARKINVGSIIKNTVKALFLLLIVSVNAIIIWRICSSSTPKELKTITPTKEVVELYRAEGDKMELFYQKQNSIVRSERAYGYFSVEHFVFIPEAKQVQVVFRYNNSTLEHLMKDYGLSEPPARELDWYDVTLVKTTDLTPDNKQDNEKAEALAKERFHATSSESYTEGLYNYRKFIFDGIDTSNAIGVLVDVFYINDIDYDKSAYGTLCIYHNESKNIPYILTADDKKAIENVISSRE